MKETDVYFDGVEIQTLNIRMLEGHENHIAPGTIDRQVYIPGQTGAYDFGADLDVIPFNLPLGIRGKSRLDMQHTVRQFKKLIIDEYGKPKTFQLKFGYEPDKYYNVRFSGDISIERVLAMGKFTLPLTCHEGHAWSVAQNDEVTWGSEVIPFASDFTFGHTGDSVKIIYGNDTSVNVTVTGKNIRPIIKISGTGTNVTIGWSGKTISLGSFEYGTWLIDLGEYVVLKDGLLALHLISGEWLTMELVQGDNLIAINGSDLDLAFSVEFRDRYY
jgi:phage-related protein